MPIRNVPEEDVTVSLNTPQSVEPQTDSFKKNAYLIDDSKPLTHLIHEYNESMSHFNHVLHALANNQLDRDALSQSLATKIEQAKLFLKDYSYSFYLSASCYQVSCNAIDYQLLRLKQVPLQVNPLVVFENVRDQFDHMRAFITKALSETKPPQNCEDDIAVQYITKLRTIITCGLEYFLANPYFPPQKLDDWLPKKGMSNTSG